MRLLEQFLRRPKQIRLRPPDYTEQRQGLFLQIWGDEGYWHVMWRLANEGQTDYAKTNRICL